MVAYYRSLIFNTFRLTFSKLPLTLHPIWNYSRLIFWLINFVVYRLVIFCQSFYISIRSELMCPILQFSNNLLFVVTLAKIHLYTGVATLALHCLFRIDRIQQFSGNLLCLRCGFKMLRKINKFSILRKDLLSDHRLKIHFIWLWLFIL